MEEIVKRINELAAIAKTRELTAVELKEREKLRKIFIKNFKDNFEKELKRVKFKD